MTAHNHDLLTNTGLEVPISVLWNAVNLIVTDSFFTASRRYKVVDIRGRIQTAGVGGACTGVIRKVPSGTAIGSGTLLHTGTFDFAGSVNTNQALTLSSTATDLELAVGDSIGLVLTGTPTTAAGNITVTLVPN